MTDYVWIGWQLEDLAKLRESKKQEAAELRQELADLDQHIAEVMPEQRVTIEGVGTLERLRGKERKQWDHDALKRNVVTHARYTRPVNPETGEITPEWEAVANALMDCIGISYWKVTELRARGLDPDEFATVSPGKYSIKVSN